MFLTSSYSPLISNSEALCNYKLQFEMFENFRMIDISNVDIFNYITSLLFPSS